MVETTWPPSPPKGTPGLGEDIRGRPGPVGDMGAVGGGYLRCMLVENCVKNEDLLPGPVCAQCVLGVLTGVHEHHSLGAERRVRGGSEEGPPGNQNRQAP